MVGGPFDNINFNFVDAVNPTGDLFILTQAYAGTPPALSGTTPGFLAESTGVSGGVYQFDPTVTLSGSTQYFFYVDQPFGGGPAL